MQQFKKSHYTFSNREKYTGFLAFQILSSERIFFSGTSWRMQRTVSPSIGITGNFSMLFLVLASGWWVQGTIAKLRTCEFLWGFEQKVGSVQLSWWYNDIESKTEFPKMLLHCLSQRQLSMTKRTSWRLWGRFNRTLRMEKGEVKNETKNKGERNNLCSNIMLEMNLRPQTLKTGNQVFNFNITKV